MQFKMDRCVELLEIWNYKKFLEIFM